MDPLSRWKEAFRFAADYGRVSLSLQALGLSPDRTAALYARYCRELQATVFRATPDDFYGFVHALVVTGEPLSETRFLDALRRRLEEGLDALKVGPRAGVRR